VNFSVIKNRLLAGLKMRIRTGELTERRLALRVGLSQPHMHNILTGERDLTIDVADRILDELNLSALDLFNRDEIVTHMGRLATDGAEEYGRTRPNDSPIEHRFPGPGEPSVPN